MKRTRSSIIVAALAVLALVALPTHALTLSAGSDIFTSPASGVTQVDLAAVPLAQAFGSGASANPVLVPLKGKPIAGLGQTDTVVERLQDVTLGGPGTSGTTTVEIVGLSLVSENPVNITVNNQTKAWNLTVTVSPSVASMGSMTITQNGVDSGIFDAQFNVYPRLVFSRTGEADVVIDCGAVNGCTDIDLSAQNSAWVTSDGNFNPAAAGVPSIGNGTTFDGDGDGVKDDVYVGGSNFHPGFAPNGSGSYQPQPLYDEHARTMHDQRPNIQCADDVAVADAEGTATTESSLTASAEPTATRKALCPQVAVADPTPVAR